MENIRNEELLGQDKVIVGNKYSNLILETLGKVYIKTGNSSRVLNDVLETIDKLNESDILSKTIIVHNTEELELLEYPGDGFFVFNTLNKSLYISYNKEYLLLISSDDGKSGYVKRSGDTMTGLLEIMTEQAPLIVSSNRLVKNLNAEYLDGYSASDFAKKNVNEYISGKWTFRNNVTAESDWLFKQNINVRNDININGEIGTPQFASGFGGYGWRLKDNTLTIDNLIVRKAMKVYELIVNLISATNGSIWVSNASKCTNAVLPILISILDLLNTYATGKLNLLTILKPNNYYLIYDSDNRTITEELTTLLSDPKGDYIPNRFAEYEYLIYIKDAEKVINSPLFLGVASLYDKTILDVSWEDFQTTHSESESIFNNYIRNVLLKYISKGKKVTVWDDTTPKKWERVENFSKTTPLYIVPRIKEENFRKTGDKNNIYGIYPYYKYFGYPSNIMGTNIWIVEFKDDTYPYFKPGDILRCLKFQKNSMKYYDALVLNQINSYTYIIKKAIGIFDEFSEIQYNKEGKVENLNITTNDKLYEQTEKAFNSNSGKVIKLYPNKTEEDRLGDICKGDNIVQMGNIYNITRLHSIYITSSDDCSPYIDVLSGINRPDFSVIYLIPDWKLIKAYISKQNDEYISKGISNFYCLTINPGSVNPNILGAPLIFVKTKTDNSILINDEISQEILNHPESFGVFITEVPTINSLLQEYGKEFGIKYTTNIKVRLGNLLGINNDMFKNNQPYGYGLYSENAFLTGEFYLNNGQSVVEFTKESIKIALQQNVIGVVNLVKNSIRVPYNEEREKDNLYYTVELSQNRFTRFSAFVFLVGSSELKKGQLNDKLEYSVVVLDKTKNFIIKEETFHISFERMFFKFELLDKRIEDNDELEIRLYYGLKESVVPGNLIIFHKVKLEKGYTLSDWSPAPEDVAEMDKRIFGNIEEIQNQIDGSIETWFEQESTKMADLKTGIPLLTDWPITLWILEILNIEDKLSPEYLDKLNKIYNRHVGDLYYSLKARAFRFQPLEAQTLQVATSYLWTEIHDTAIIEALNLALHALYTADGKRRVFVRKPTDADEYDEGDLWVNATYPINPVTGLGPDETVINKETGKIEKCKDEILRVKDGIFKKPWNDKLAPDDPNLGEKFNIEHWQLASGISLYLEKVLEEAKKLSDKKVESWFLDTDPATTETDEYPNGWNTDEIKSIHLGDFWYGLNHEIDDPYDTTKPIGKVKRKKLKCYTKNEKGEYVWELVEDLSLIDAFKKAEKAQDTADGKTQTFIERPTPPYNVGDFWLNAYYDPDRPNETFEDPNVEKPKSTNANLNIYSNETLRCLIDKPQKDANGNIINNSFSINDWVLASKYTDDTTANKAIQELKDIADDGIITPQEKLLILKYWEDIVNNYNAENTNSLNKYRIYNVETGEFRMKDGYTNGFNRLKSLLQAYDNAFRTLKIFVENQVLLSMNKNTEMGKNTLIAPFNSFFNARTALRSIIGANPGPLEDLGILYFKDSSTIVATANKFVIQDSYKNPTAIIKSEGVLTTSCGEFNDIKIRNGEITLGERLDPNKNIFSCTDEDYKIWAGIGGIPDTSIHGNGVAAWYGGEKIDILDGIYNHYQKDTENGLIYLNDGKWHSYAKGADRFDGTGYRAGGNLWWDDKGNIHTNSDAFFIGQNQLTPIMTLLQLFSPITSGLSIVGIQAKYPLKVRGEVTAYAGEAIDSDSIFRGLPIDPETLQWKQIAGMGTVLSVIGGAGGSGDVKDVTTSGIFARSIGEWVSLDSILNNYVQENKFTNHINDTTKHIKDSERTSWNNKVDKIQGKGLSTNDFTDTLKNKLDNLSLVTTTTNGLMSYLDKIKLNGLSNYELTKAKVEDVLTGTITSHYHNPAQINTDIYHKFVSDSQISTWNGKLDASTWNSVFEIIGGNLYVKTNLYGRKEITAYSTGSSGGGGGGGSYTLPVASYSRLGGIIVGDGLEITSNGILSVVSSGGGGTVTGNYLPLSGGTLTGSIIIDGSDSIGVLPSRTNYNTIGSAEYRFYKGYFNNLYTKGIVYQGTTSDAYNSANYVFTCNGGVKKISEIGGGSGGGSSYTLPVASLSTLGGVKIGSGINVATDGTISVSSSGGGGTGNYLPLTGGTLTGNLTISNSSNSKLTIRDSDAYLMLKDFLSFIGSTGYGLFLHGGKGVWADNTVYSDKGFAITTSSDDYVLLAGGGTKALSTFSSGGGSYTLPKASSSTLGGVKIGSGINISSDGTISVSSGGSSSGNYLPLSGGELTGKLKVQNDILITKNSTAYGLFPHSDGTNTIGDSRNRWYSGYINNIYGKFHHKDNNSDNYVLLAGGGTKLVSSFGGSSDKGLVLKTRNVYSGSTTLSVDDDFVIANNSGSLAILTLPSSAPTGKIIFFKLLTGSGIRFIGNVYAPTDNNPNSSYTLTKYAHSFFLIHCGSNRWAMYNGWN